VKVCVFGLWHLGTVTAACLVSGGHEVVGLDFDAEVISKLQGGTPPLFEPDLEALMQAGLSSGKLRFTTDPADALAGAEVLWVAYDTPVDDNDNALVDFVIERVEATFTFLASNTLVLVSSQLPVGTTRLLEMRCRAQYPDTYVTFGYSPENLRLGGAIKVFTAPDRVVVGLRDEADREKVQTLLKPFTENIVWMSVESAEMTKHALNAFLATSVTFANEIAVLCEYTGADAKEVERGLKSESRIGPKAYLAPGAAFAGGTLARDIRFLNVLGEQFEQQLPLMAGVSASNDRHKSWGQRKLLELLSDLNNRTVAVWGLTYKPGTDTLRRSSAIELCYWAAEQGATVKTHDPAVKVLPEDLRAELSATALDAIHGADALIISTAWVDYREISADAVQVAAPGLTVIDQSRFLEKTLGSDARLRYVTIGKSL
jgi:UDPglucose 6-dehydrogenase